MYFDYGGWTGGSCTLRSIVPATAWYFAEGNCRIPFDPNICIQNPEDTDAAVTITYMQGNTQNSFQSFPVPRSSRVTVPVKGFLGVGNDEAHDFSALVEAISGVSIICERPMGFDYSGWTGGHCVMGFAP